ncbi:TRAP transporter substrate-binding protein [Prosthecomicrobium hirschii]|uniref:TRAP transporter substrate-binding protein n=1 Tax=Prosthecodimorpha hirschii TaxID=665126 RepID=UPI002220D7E4|nr:TRAP transporter substrate-binding protein [Prosthecomicrobium hirschii]MCW1840337.1 TRAP transporter substrate-binding protein [Prosthecomicrobium hirschii]
MTGTVSRRRALAAAGAALAAPLATPALAKGLAEWKMVTSWPKNLPGPGLSAERLAQSIARLTDGRLTVKVYAAGELVPALECFDAVSGGTAEMAHTAAIYWQGKMPAAPLFTTAPFGLTPLEHMIWIDQAGGQALWEKLYRPFGVQPYMGGNTGFSMAGWFRREVNGLEDLKGLRIRVVGLGGEIYRRLGATPVSLPTGEVLPALQAGVVDAAEVLAPYSDLAFGYHRVTKTYYGPGFNKPNGTGEAIVSIKALEALPADLRDLVAAACRQEHANALTLAEWNNASSLEVLKSTHGIGVKPMPADILAAAARHGEDLLGDIAARDAVSREVVDSYRATRLRTGGWLRITQGSFLDARQG